MRRSFRVEISTDHTGTVSVRVPAIPQVQAEARTKEQALLFAANAVTAHLKSLSAAGVEVPESDVDAIVIEI